MMSEVLSLPLTLSLFLLCFSFSSADYKTQETFKSETQEISKSESYAGSFSKVYAFGGSGTDTGNAYSMGSVKEEVVSSSSKQVTVTHSESSSQQTSTSTSYSDGRMTNGHLVVDYLCKSLDIPPLPPYQSAKGASSSNSSVSTSSSSSSNSSTTASSSNSGNSGTDASSSNTKKGASSSNSGAGASQSNSGTGSASTGASAGSAGDSGSGTGASAGGTGDSASRTGYSAGGTGNSAGGADASAGSTGAGASTGSAGASAGGTGTGASSGDTSASADGTGTATGGTGASAGGSGSGSGTGALAGGASADGWGAISGSINFNFGVNFAIAGSTFLSRDNFTNQNANPLFSAGIPLPFQTEIDWFKEFLESKGCSSVSNARCKAEVENALFWLGAVGVSDYSRINGQSVVSIRGISQLCILHISRLLQVVLEAGAKYIVVQGLPPVGCLPVCIAPCPFFLLDRTGCSMAVNTAIDLHNRLLVKTIERFRIQYPQSTILYANYWKAFLEIFNNGRKYKFAEKTKACCGAGGGTLNFDPKSLCGSPGASSCKNPEKYISWDGIHFTDAMNEKLAHLFLKEDYCEPSFSELIKKRKSAMSK